MVEAIVDGKSTSTIEVLRKEYGIDIAPLENLDLLDSNQYIPLKDNATELLPIIGEIQNLVTSIANYKALSQTAYSITFNGQNVLPSQLFQKNNGALISNLKSETGVGFGKHTDVLLKDYGATPALDIANIVFGVASAVTATYYLKAMVDEVGTIKADTQNTINLLKFEKQAEIENDLKILHQIFDEIDEIKKDEILRLSTLNQVKNIGRSQGANALSYEKNFNSEIQKYQTCRGKNRKMTARDLGQDYQYYRLSTQTYAMAKVIELELESRYSMGNKE